MQPLKSHLGRSRMVVTVVLLLSVYMLPWWVVFLLGVVSTIIFDSYYEFLALLLLYDLTYAVSTAHFLSFPFLLSISGMGLYGILAFIKARTMLHG